MSLKEEQTYDLIIMDAFGDENCAPDIFYDPKYVSKLKQQLTSNGILVNKNLLLEFKLLGLKLGLIKRHVSLNLIKILILTKTSSASSFKDEINLSNFLLSTGEIYFINENFK